MNVNSMEECNSNYSTVPFTVYRTVSDYQTTLKEGSPLPLYISSFSVYEVSFDSGEARPILNENLQPHGISVRSDQCAHMNCTFIPEISGKIWAKNDKVCITPENFEANTAVENYNQGERVKINAVKREIKAYMCYELPAGTELPDPFRLRVDNANHCTIYWDPSASGSPPEITKCRVGEIRYFHSPALHALPWKVHCFKMEARAEPSDLIGAPPSDPGIALVSVLLKYMEYVESDDAHWLTIQTDNLHLLTSEGMTVQIREKLEQIKYNINNWIDSYDWYEMVKFSDELDKILDERKLNRKNTAAEVKY